MMTRPTWTLPFLALLVLLTAAVPAAAQEPTDHSSSDKAARPATTPAGTPADTAAAAEVPAPASRARVTMGFGTGIDRDTRELVGEATSFAAGDTVWCRTVVQDLPHPTTITHAWYHDGTTMARVELNVGSAHWRTWSSKIIPESLTGPWEVKVLNADGSVLASSAFEIR